MAFFTKLSSNVPFLPSDQCHQEDTNSLPPVSPSTSTRRDLDLEYATCSTSTSTLDNVDAKDNKQIRDKADGVESSQNGEEPTRFEYVVDRVRGVEV